MKPFMLERKQILPISLDQVWSFFRDPGNLARITPPAMDFRMTSPHQDNTYAGQIISYNIRPLFGISMDWVTEITHVNKPIFFVDEQRFGPYRFWHHQHRFRQTEDGVEMQDLVHYLLPHMQFTRLANRLIVEPRLRKIFEFRHKALLEIFPAHCTDDTNP